MFGLFILCKKGGNFVSREYLAIKSLLLLSINSFLFLLSCCNYLHLYMKQVFVQDLNEFSKTFRQ
ncbi:hypothetical protein Hanom_Chr13g01242101 [Helianthus anomalus]